MGASLVEQILYLAVGAVASFIAFVITLLVHVILRIRRGPRSIPIVAWLFLGAAICLPAFGYYLFKAEENRRVLARVPQALAIAEIEYRLERAWGFGPGGNETGLVVYRLTDESSAWVQSQGDKLGQLLPGGTDRWHSTPVGQAGDWKQWHHFEGGDPPLSLPAGHQATIAEFHARYGFSISIEPGRDAEANQAIQQPGSFYAYGGGGSVTIVDPRRGKVYFAFAG